MAEEDVNEDKDEEENEGGDDESDDENSEGSSKTLIIIIVLLLVLIGGGAGLYFSGFLDSYIGEKVEEHAEGEEEYDADALVGDPVFVQMNDILVNLNSPKNRRQHLKLSVHLELKRQEDEEAVIKLMPRIIDKVRGYLSELRVQDVRGSMGMARLRTELKARVNLAIHPIEIRNILFQEIIIQE